MTRCTEKIFLSTIAPASPNAMAATRAWAQIDSDEVRVRAVDGMAHDLRLIEIKPPAESTLVWEYPSWMQRISGEQTIASKAASMRELRN